MMLVKNLASNLYTIAGVNNVTAAAGLQNYMSGSHGTTGQLQSIFNLVAAGANQSVILKKLQVVHHYTNNGNATMWCQHFELTPRTKIPTGLTSVAQIYEAGLSDAGAVLATYPGITPFDSTKLVQLFKVTRVRRFKLTGGQTKTITRTWVPMYRVSETSNFNTDFLADPKYTRSDITVFYGLGGENAANAVGSGEVQLGLQTTTKIYWAAAQDSANDIDSGANSWQAVVNVVLPEDPAAADPVYIL